MVLVFSEKHRDKAMAGSASFRPGGPAANRDRNLRSRCGGACHVRADSGRTDHRYLSDRRRLHRRDLAGLREPHAGGNRRIRCNVPDRAWWRQQGAADCRAPDVPPVVSLSSVRARAWSFRQRGGVEKLARGTQFLKSRSGSQTGELSLSPTIPATISVRQMTRTGSVGSLKITIPTMMLRAAPIPVQIAYAVPKGSDRNARAIRAKLSRIATAVAAVGQNRVSPSKYFRPKAQAISSSPAANSASHALTVCQAPAGRSARHIGHSHETSVQTLSLPRSCLPWKTIHARDRRAA